MLKPTKLSEIKRAWHLFDAKDKVLGRMAIEIAKLLTGKDKPYFVRHLDCGDYVVVVNAKNIKVTGKKEKQKTYENFSGYPGGLKSKTLGQLRKENPTRIIIEAIGGMLPNNKLKDRMLTRLYVFADENHPYKQSFSLNKDKFTK